MSDNTSSTLQVLDIFDFLAKFIRTCNIISTVMYIHVTIASCCLLFNYNFIFILSLLCYVSIKCIFENCSVLCCVIIVFTIIMLMECLNVGRTTWYESEGASKYQVQRVFDVFKPFVTAQSQYFKILPKY